MLQKSNASPIFGLIESPVFPHSDNSFHQGTALMFPWALGKTVSPPSSTSELYDLKVRKSSEEQLWTYN